MATYSQTTFAQAKTRLAALLGDGGKVFYTDAELGRYLIEALRAWGLYAEYWITRSDYFDTVVGECFYDLQTALGLSSQSFTVTDREIINDAIYQLMETQISAWGGGWVGTEMFTLDEITDALDKARSVYLFETAQIAGVISPIVQGALDNIVDLDQKTVWVRRASWQNVGETTRRPLWPIDTNQQQTTSMSAVRPQPTTPRSYLLYGQPVLTLELSPIPSRPGQIRLITCQVGAALTPTVGASTLGLPDDCSWLLRYKVLADVLSGDGLARAPEMSKYCADRWRDGLETVRRYRSVIRFYPQGRQTQPTSLAQRDSIQPGWETQTAAAARQIALPSWNLAVLDRPPAAIARINVDLVSKAPIPSVDGDFLQINAAYLPAIYDYAQHIATFKMQGAEFAATLPLLEGFFEAARGYRSSQAAVAPSYWQLNELGPIQEKEWKPVWKAERESESRELVKEVN